MLFLQKNKSVKALNKIDSSSNIFFGFSEWKHDFIKKIFGGNCYFFTTKDANSSDFLRLFEEKITLINNIYVWSYNDPYWLFSFCLSLGKNFCRIEDGFIRSNSLGAKKSIPKSLVIDNSGTMYFDAARESQLHNLIRNLSLDEEKTTEAKNYIDRIIKNNISKYNLPNSEHSYSIKNAILVIGQNENDMSIAKSGAIFTTNETLLRYVASKNVGRDIIYKPHPDTINNDASRRSYPEKVDGVLIINDLHYLFDNISNINEVHTISSLLGFEFLFRGLKVYCYSRTWYSGWGLTKDTYSSEDTIYKKTVIELFYCAYILYPFYYNSTFQPVTIENTLNSLLGYDS
ncbi:capsular polysaccharide export protein, LipB/KpsS family [Psychrobacter sp. AOP22-C1-C5]|uniref:capsular polysaccharide export protein, LipB/KpsS family n=1 Tax=Psychrobacter sp. AOP22-C1-C5 TaxID=3457716 RepID=UPI004035057E